MADIGKRIVTCTKNMLQEPHKFEIDIIHANTDEDDHTTCHKCELGRLDQYEKSILVGVMVNKPKKYNLHTYYCNNCDYCRIDDDDTRAMRRFLK